MGQIRRYGQLAGRADLSGGKAGPRGKLVQEKRALACTVKGGGEKELNQSTPQSMLERELSLSLSSLDRWWRPATGSNLCQLPPLLAQLILLCCSLSQQRSKVWFPSSLFFHTTVSLLPALLGSSFHPPLLVPSARLLLPSLPPAACVSRSLLPCPLLFSHLLTCHPVVHLCSSHLEIPNALL